MNSTLVVWLQLLGILALEVGVLAGLATLLARFTQSAAWRRTIWQVGLLATIALLALELSGVARQSFGWRGNVARNELPTSIVPGGGPVYSGRLSEEFRSQILARAAEKRTIQQTPPGPSPAAAVAEARAAAPTPAGAKPPVRLDSPAADSIPVICFVLVWAGGVALVLGRALFCRAMFSLLRRNWRGLADQELNQCVRSLARGLGMRRPVRLIESSRFASPLAFGIWRPTIGLPAGFAERFAPAQREAMLAHELAHLWARDPAWRLLADFATAMLWWHPLSWWLRRQLHAASETAADEASLLVANGPSVLAECLVVLGAGMDQRLPFGSLGMEGNGFRSGLGRRVARLVQLNGAAWSPPSPRRSALVKTFGPAALVLTVVLCTAGVVPPALTKGENMQTMKNTWKRSLAALALLTALETDHNITLAGQPEPLAAPQPEAAQNAPGGGLPAAGPQATVPPEAAPQRTLPDTVSTTPAAGATLAAPTGLPGGNATPLRNGAVSFAPAMPAPAIAARYGIGGGDGAVSFASAAARQDAIRRDSARNGLSQQERHALETKLEQITIDNVKYDGLPLEEVIRQLVVLSAARDPNRLGINFVLDREAAPGPGLGSVDPTTGLPVQAELPDLREVPIHLDPALRHVRLVDLLDAITKVAEKPIKYSVEEYGVVFSLDREKLGTVPGFVAGPAPLAVRTFQVDTNTFFAGLGAAFGIEARANSGQTRGALKALLQQLGISMDFPNKSVFYNDLTGVLMVRATPDDLEVVEAAVETLGGRRFASAANGLPARGGN